MSKGPSRDAENAPLAWVVAAGNRLELHERTVPVRRSEHDASRQIHAINMTACAGDAVNLAQCGSRRLCGVLRAEVFARKLI